MKPKTAPSMRRPRVTWERAGAAVTRGDGRGVRDELGGEDIGEGGGGGGIEMAR